MIAVAHPDTLIEAGIHPQGRVDGTQPRSIEPNGLMFDVPSFKENSFSARLIASYQPPANDTIGFKPLLIDKSISNNSALKQAAGLRFNISNDEYYPALRGVGYALQALFTTGTFRLSKFLLPGITHVTKQGEQAFLLVEAGVFIGLAIGYMAKDSDRLLGDFRPALAAELGKPQDQIHSLDMGRSHNPMIVTEFSELLWKTAIRIGAGAGFARSLTTGLLGLSLNITTERILSRVNAFGQLKALVEETQHSHQEGEWAVDKVTNGFKTVLQEIQRDQNRAPVTEKQMDELHPILVQMARDTVDGKINLQDLVAIIGGGILVVGNPAQSAVNYAFIQEHGLQSMIEMAQQLRIEKNDPPGGIWERFFPVQNNDPNPPRPRPVTDRIKNTTGFVPIGL
jgi:hypothetical protein